MTVTKDTPKLLFSAKSNGIIWKIKLDDACEQLAFEVRTTNKQVSFYAYDFKNHKELVNDYTFEENWLLGLDHLQNGMAFFHGYESEFSPVHKGIIAFDFISKKIIWQNFSVAVQLYSTDGIIVFDAKVFPRKYELLNPINGQKIKALSLEELSFYNSFSNQILLPELNQSPDILDTCFTLKHQNIRIKSSYQLSTNKTQQIIKVLKNDELCFSEILNEDIQKIGADAFMLWLGKLIYIKNKSEILTYLV